jgi:hypothetical protein
LVALRGNRGILPHAAGLKTLAQAVAGAFRDPATRGNAVAVTMALPVVALTLPALVRLLVSPGSTFSVFSLIAALVIAACTIALRRLARGRRISVKLLRRAIFPRWLVRSASTRADLGFWLLNTMATGMMIGWAALSFPAVANWSSAALVACLGSPPAPWLAPLAVQANRVKKSYRDEAREELVVPPGDLTPDAE